MCELFTMGVFPEVVWPTVLICLGVRGFLGLGTFCAKTGRGLRWSLSQILFLNFAASCTWSCCFFYVLVLFFNFTTSPQTYIAKAGQLPKCLVPYHSPKTYLWYFGVLLWSNTFKCIWCVWNSCGYLCWWSYNPVFGQWKHIQCGPLIFSAWSLTCVSNDKIGILRPRSRFSHFSKDPCFLLVGNGVWKLPRGY